MSAAKVTRHPHWWSLALRISVQLFDFATSCVFYRESHGCILEQIHANTVYIGISCFDLRTTCAKILEQYHFTAGGLDKQHIIGTQCTGARLFHYTVLQICQELPQWFITFSSLVQLWPEVTHMVTRGNLLTTVAMVEAMNMATICMD